MTVRSYVLRSGAWRHLTSLWATTQATTLGDQAAHAMRCEKGAACRQRVSTRRARHTFHELSHYFQFSLFSLTYSQQSGDEDVPQPAAPRDTPVSRVSRRW